MNPKLKTGLSLVGLFALSAGIYAISYVGGTYLGRWIGDGLVGIIDSKKK